MRHRRRHFQYVCVPQSIVDTSKPQFCQQPSYVGGDEAKEVLDILGPAGESLAQFGILRRYSDRAGVEVTYPHHDAPGRDEWRRGKPVLLRPQQRGDDDVPRRAQTPVTLDDDPIA